VVSLAGKVAVVTGAGAGIGRAYARALVANGAAVVVVDVDGNAAHQVSEEIRAGGGRADVYVGDVSADDTAGAVANLAERSYGRLDILVNNAGLHLPEFNQPLTTFDHAKWHSILAVNVTGALYFAEACSRVMIDGGRGGVIINQSSIAAYRPVGAYGVTKLALNGLTMALAAELGEHNIRVNGIAPGLILTEATLSGMSKERREQSISQQLIRRSGSVEDVVGMLLFLCSDAGNWITGETFAVTGGRLRRV
jgi:NAD(P)-dependent dehydrogenase (short-subunit alcohol dehydrogenase family)